MSNFKIVCSNPWLLLLLILAIVITLFPYFRLPKRYRRTRNRVVSIVLHMIVMVLSICVLAGMTFTYDVPNRNNEVMLLVDVSYSGEKAAEKRNQFIQDALIEGNSQFKMGVVTFGYDQVYAVRLTNDTDSVYSAFLESLDDPETMPDVSATDIAAALQYTAELFENPETSKIVLVTDGLETDGSAMSIIKSVAAKGIQVDVSYVAEAFERDEVQLVSVALPDRNLKLNEQFEISLDLQSSYVGNATVTLVDTDENGVVIESDPVDIELTMADVLSGEAQTQTVKFTHEFDSRGVHEIRFRIESPEKDNLAENNVYCAYIYLEEFNKILVLEETPGQTDTAILTDILSSQEHMGVEYEVTTMALNSDEVPTTVAGLQDYDQVILVNVSNAGMPAGFDTILNSYVKDMGGALLTVGGDKAYDYKDLYEYNSNGDAKMTLYQQMLPVLAVEEYTPPLGVVFIIDRSGSMGSFGETTKLQQAKDAVISCLEFMKDWDYVGIMTLENNYATELKLTPRTHKEEIIEAVRGIGGAGGGTVFGNAIRRAGQALRALSSVERRHIVIITDGQPSDPLESSDTRQGYGDYIKSYYEESGITFSVMGIGMNEATTNKMKDACALAGGEEAGSNAFNVTGTEDSVSNLLTKDLTSPPIKGTNADEIFTPTIDEVSTLARMIAKNQIETIPEMSGFTGTRLRSDATAIVKGPAVPIYAQHKYGNGMVGSLTTSMAQADPFLHDASGIGDYLLQCIVNELFPTKSIRSHDIDIVVQEENYRTQVSVFTSLGEGESIDVTITPPAGQSMTIHRDALNYSRLTFSVTAEEFRNLSGSYTGVYSITATKLNAEGEAISSYTTYSVFSYSAEYDEFADASDREEFLTNLADSGKGNLINEVSEVFGDFEVVIHKTFDPRLTFIIIAIVLFLLDVAVRKFKFKWIHELVAEHNEKKGSKKK